MCQSLVAVITSFLMDLIIPESKYTYRARVAVILIAECPELGAPGPPGGGRKDRVYLRDEPVVKKNGVVESDR